MLAPPVDVAGEEPRVRGSPVTARCRPPLAGRTAAAGPKLDISRMPSGPGAAAGPRLEQRSGTARHTRSRQRKAGTGEVRISPHRRRCAAALSQRQRRRVPETCYDAIGEPFHTKSGARHRRAYLAGTSSRPGVRCRSAPPKGAVRRYLDGPEASPRHDPCRESDRRRRRAFRLACGTRSYGAGYEVMLAANAERPPPPFPAARLRVVDLRMPAFGLEWCDRCGRCRIRRKWVSPDTGTIARRRSIRLGADQLSQQARRRGRGGSRLLGKRPPPPVGEVPSLDRQDGIPQQDPRGLQPATSRRRRGASRCTQTLAAEAASIPQELGDTSQARHLLRARLACASAKQSTAPARAARAGFRRRRCDARFQIGGLPYGIVPCSLPG